MKITEYLQPTGESMDASCSSLGKSLCDALGATAMDWAAIETDDGRWEFVLGMPEVTEGGAPSHGAAPGPHGSTGRRSPFRNRAA